MTAVILDVDTGVDDALALLLAARHPQLSLRAVTCVSGNVPVDQVVRNTLAVLDIAGAGQVPVARGADRPLLAAPRHATHVHGSDGLADLTLAASARRPEACHAVELLRREILASPQPITLVPLGPLTNIALLLRTYPEVSANIDRIVFMGGTAAVGNATPVAEFNIWHDPEAASIVLSAEVPLTMYGLDVFYRVAIAPSTVDKLAVSEHTAARLAAQLLRHSAISADAGETRLPAPGTACLGDAGAVCALLDPGGLGTESLPVRVSLDGMETRGQTIVDRRGLASEASGQDRILEVALTVDASRYCQLFVETMLGGAQ